MPPTYRVAFERLTDDNHCKTSEFDPTYNCIGYAAGSKLWWQPLPLQGGQRYWPPSAPQEMTIDAYIKAFESERYQLCDNGTFEEGVEKIAIFTKNGVPTHAARQIDAVYWTSKLGKGIDIWHTLESVGGNLYGDPAVYMRRPK